MPEQPGSSVLERYGSLGVGRIKQRRLGLLNETEMNAEETSKSTILAGLLDGKTEIVLDNVIGDIYFPILNRERKQSTVGSKIETD